MGHVLLVIKCLLIHPNPESALNEEAGKLLLEQFAFSRASVLMVKSAVLCRYDDFAKHARMMTEIHAKPRKDPTEEAEEVSVVILCIPQGCDDCDGRPRQMRLRPPPLHQLLLLTRLH